MLKKDEDGGTGARAPRRKRFGLFQFDFSSVAVALTTIRRRGTLSVPLFVTHRTTALLPSIPFSLAPIASDRRNERMGYAQMRASNPGQ